MRCGSVRSGVNNEKINIAPINSQSDNVMRETCTNV